MGLPHVVVRFYTNPDGRAARRTTLLVLALLSAFYLLPTLYGVLGRIYASDLVASGKADSVVLDLPQRMLGGAGGELLSALVGAGAFAAFLSTSSGLVVSVAGVISQDLMSRWHEGVRAFRLAGVHRRRGDPRAGRRLGGSRGRPRGRAGLRGRRVDLLPAAGARHLVAGAHRAGRDRRACSSAASSPAPRWSPRWWGCRSKAGRAPCSPSRPW